MSGGFAYWRRLSEDERLRTLDRWDELVDAACEGVAAGFRATELHELVYAPAKALGVYVWPTLAADVVREARRITPRTY